MVNMIAMPQIQVEKTAQLTGHRDCVYTLERASTGRCFFSGAGDGMVVLWDLNNPENGELIAKVENSVYALKYLPKEHHLLIGHNFQGVHLIDVQSKKELRSAAITDSYIFDIAVQADKILVTTGNGVLIVLSTSDLSTLIKIKLSNQSLRCIAISPDGKYIAIGSSDNFIRILEAETLALLYEFEAHKNSVFSLKFSPDGQYLISGSRDAHLKIWNVEHKFEIKEMIVAHMYAINDIEYSPDGLFFATCSMDKSIKIWDAQVFQLLKVIDKARYAGHGTSVNKLYWSTYENKLISGSDDRNISVWDIDFNHK